MAPEGLRLASDRDAWALTALIAACWSEYPGCVVDVAGEYPELLAPASHFQRFGGALWVLPERHWVAACVGLAPAGPGEVELLKLYVAPHRRGRGLGRSLVAWVEDEAGRQGAGSVALWSDTRFLPAHRLYERLGYTRTGAARELHDLSHTVEHEFRKRL